MAEETKRKLRKLFVVMDYKKKTYFYNILENLRTNYISLYALPIPGFSQ